MVTYLSRWPRTEPTSPAPARRERRHRAAGRGGGRGLQDPAPGSQGRRHQPSGAADLPAGRPPSSACCGTPRRYGACCGSGRPTWSSRSASSHWCSAGSPDDAPVPRWSGACTTGSTAATSPGSWCRRSATSSLGWSTGSWSTAAPRWPRSGPAGRRSSWPPRPSRWTRATSTRPATRYAASSCSARLSPWKGQDVFLRAFAEAFEGSPAEAFVVGGALFGETEYEQSLKTLAAELGIADRVHFVGHVQDPWAWPRRRGRPGARLDASRSRSGRSSCRACGPGARSSRARRAVRPRSSPTASTVC